jgi:hypothetical protein
VTAPRPPRATTAEKLAGIPAAPTEARTYGPTATTKTTLLLDERRNRILKSASLDAGGTGGAAILRALLDRLDADPHLRDSVIAAAPDCRSLT